MTESESTYTYQSNTSSSDAGDETPTAPTVEESGSDGTSPQPSENAGFRVQTVEPEGDTHGETAPGHDPINPDTGSSPDWQIKSRREEEDAQHARREAGDAIVEEGQAAAGKTPF